MAEFVPFGGLIDRIRNREDDDFDPNYGDPGMIGDDDTNAREGVALVLMTVIFLFILVVLRYGCIWFIDVVILCDHRRYRGSCRSRFGRLLSLCCPRRFPPSGDDSGDPEGGSGDNPGDDPTATVTSNNSSSDSNSSGDSSDEDGMEMVRASNSNYAKRLMKMLTEDQKRSLFASVLVNRTVTKADVSGWPGEEESHHSCNCNCNCNCTPADTTGENHTTTTTEEESSSSIVVPDGGPSPAATPPATTPNADNAICCPICIHDIRVGDRVCHSKRKNCHHLFHFDCILEWLGTGSTLCPYCRREIFTRRMLEEAYQKQQQQKQPSKKQLGV